MADASIEDRLVAIETVQMLKETLAWHEELIARMTKKLDSIEARLAAVEAPRT